MVTWRQVPALQLELACLPSRWRRNIQVFVPRYARPVVLAVGQAKFHHDPPKNPISRLLRRSFWRKSLALLEQLQAPDDSFLASVPLTAFVVMSLGSVGCQQTKIVERGIEFLLASVRADSSWSNTPNRAVANSALALSSLLAANVQHEPAAHNATWEDTARVKDTLPDHLPSGIHTHPEQHDTDHPHHTNVAVTQDCVEWLLGCQRSEPDTLTEVTSGGWASSDAAGALPNTCATAGVIAALIQSHSQASGTQRERIERAAGRGVVWLLELQNEDGGWATFYRDDTLLRRDESGTDVTAQVLRALAAWRRDWRTEGTADARRRWSFIDERAARAIDTGWKYLESQQEPDGSFIPLWFGNEHQPNGKNPVYGTAQVLFAAAELDRLNSDLAQRASRWLVAAQHSNGGWGPPRAAVSYSGAERDGAQARRTNEAMSKYCSVEETSLAISALIPLAETNQAVGQTVSRGYKWLTSAIEQDGHRKPANIGYSLAKLWYHERLNPLAFAAGTLSRAMRSVGARATAASHVG
jgi:squalene-hopene/tetraprenyl-beta-curcumene cyclase